MGDTLYKVTVKVEATVDRWVMASSVDEAHDIALSTTGWDEVDRSDDVDWEITDYEEVPETSDDYADYQGEALEVTAVYRARARAAELAIACKLEKGEDVPEELVLATDLSKAA